MLTLLARLCLTAATIMAIAAIWTPYHWQAGLTAALLLFVGAALAGNATKEIR